MKVWCASKSWISYLKSKPKIYFRRTQNLSQQKVCWSVYSAEVNFAFGRSFFDVHKISDSQGIAFDISEQQMLSLVLHGLFPQIIGFRTGMLAYRRRHSTPKHQSHYPSCPPKKGLLHCPFLHILFSFCNISILIIRRQSTPTATEKTNSPTLCSPCNFICQQSVLLHFFQLFVTYACIYTYRKV